MAFDTRAPTITDEGVRHANKLNASGEVYTLISLAAEKCSLTSKPGDIYSDISVRVPPSARMLYRTIHVLEEEEREGDMCRMILPSTMYTTSSDTLVA